MDLQNTSCRDAHSMHPLVGALQPKNVPSLERQALSLQLLLHQPPCDAPASCVHAKGLCSYKKLNSSVLGLFLFLSVSVLYTISSCSVFLLYSVHLHTPLTRQLPPYSIPHQSQLFFFYSIHFPIVGFISSCWSGVTERNKSVCQCC